VDANVSRTDAASEHRYCFADFTLDLEHGFLLRDGEPVNLRPQAFELLAYLVARHGTLVTKEELVRSVWRDVAVTDNSLSQCLVQIRRVLGDERQEMIRTVARRGYVFAAPVTVPVVAFPGEPRAQLSAVPSAVTTARGPRMWRRASLAAALLVALIGGALLWEFGVRPGGRGPRVSASVGPPDSLAVLPFRSLNQAAAPEYLGIGMADSLITRLGLLRGLDVRPLASVQLYADGKKDPQTAGRELHVQSVLEGSLQSDDDRIRVRVRLYRVGDGQLLWAGQFDEPLRSFLDVQDSISEKVAAALSLTLPHKVQSPVSPAAYENFVRGRFFFEQFTEDGNRRAIEYFGRAIEAEPGYALAYAGLSINYAVMLARGFIDPQQGIPKARNAAARALMLDDTLAETHTAMAGVEIAEYAWDAAERSLKRAIELNPNYLHAWGWYAYLLSALGRTEEGLAVRRREVEIDPVSFYATKDLGAGLREVGRPQEAVEQLRRALELRPDFIVTHGILARTYLDLNRPRDAILEFEAAKNPVGVAYVRALQGDREPARSLIAKLNAVPYSQVSVALLQTVVGDSNNAVASLEKGYELRNPGLAFVNVDERFAPLRNLAGFKDLVARLHLKHLS
jgi:DNA-binding winged helix-turn-helix (wHTH) protein/TolB-like protein/Flp pilus assembly protein TadD